MARADRFAEQLLDWFDRHGRKSLPWQQNPTPYRVWVSEIMLQQTQVQTVRAYFERFTARFPDVNALALAPMDDVLQLWSGLGYYARARNLHRAAQIVHEQHAGQFPEDIEELTALPGIGRSTAGAIASLAMGQRQPILDGNVKRVLARYHAVEGWPGNSAAARELWTHAENHTPHERVADYTQAIMDLGATLCVRRSPPCGECPLADGCLAHAEGRQHELPASKPKKERPLREIRFIIARDPQSRVLLEQRPPAGIWGGLWSFPECGLDDDPSRWCTAVLGVTPASSRDLPAFTHGFTHFELKIAPALIQMGDAVAEPSRLDDRPLAWHSPDDIGALGLPAPVARLLDYIRRLRD